MSNLNRVDTAEAMTAFIRSAAPGERVVYHDGVLAIDRDAVASRLPPVERQQLIRLASLSMRMASVCMLHLFQVRNGEEAFLYIAERSSAPLDQDLLA